VLPYARLAGRVPDGVNLELPADSCSLRRDRAN
jgi:hypothetical protein